MGFGEFSIISGAVTPYDPVSKAYFNSLSIQPSDSWKSAFDIMIRGMRADGNLTLLDYFVVFATEKKQHAQINIVNPVFAQITEVNSPTWTANQGYTGDGATTYINTNFNPAISGINFTQNNASHGWYSRSAGINSSVVMGSTNAGAQGNSINPNSSATFKVNFRMNSAAVAGTINQTNTQGLYYAYRTDPNNIIDGKNGSDIQSLASSSVPLINQSFYILCNNTNNAPSTFTNGQISMAFIGSGSINQSALYTRFQTFATTIGFNV